MPTIANARQRFSGFENYCPLYEHSKGDKKLKLQVEVRLHSRIRIHHRVSEFIVAYQYYKATSSRKLSECSDYVSQCAAYHSLLRIHRRVSVLQSYVFPQARGSECSDYVSQCTEYHNLLRFRMQSNDSNPLREETMTGVEENT